MNIIYIQKELDKYAVVANSATTASDGTKPVIVWLLSLDKEDTKK